MHAIPIEMDKKTAEIYKPHIPVAQRELSEDETKIKEFIQQYRKQHPTCSRRNMKRAVLRAFPNAKS